MERLKKLDKIAYVRFASVYRDFQDAEAFLVELKDSVPGYEIATSPGAAKGCSGTGGL